MEKGVSVLQRLLVSLSNDFSYPYDKNIWLILRFYGTIFPLQELSSDSTNFNDFFEGG